MQRLLLEQREELLELAAGAALDRRHRPDYYREGRTERLAHQLDGLLFLGGTELAREHDPQFNRTVGLLYILRLADGFDRADLAQPSWPMA